MGRPRKQLTAEPPVHLSLDSILPPGIDARIDTKGQNIEELAASIKTQGLLEPICVRPSGKSYEIVFGHRRYMAHRRLKAATILAYIRNYNDEQMLTARLTENVDRVNLTAFEEATYYVAMRDKLHLTNKQLSAKFGKSEAYVSQRTTIMTWNKALINALKEQRITFSVGRELSRIDEPGLLAFLLDAAITNGATPAIVKKWVDDELLKNTQVEFQAPTQEQFANTPAYEPPSVLCFFSQQPVLIQDARNIWCAKAVLQRVVQLILDNAQAIEK